MSDELDEGAEAPEQLDECPLDMAGVGGLIVALKRFRLDAEDAGFWGGDPASLETECSGNVWDLIGNLSSLAAVCDAFYVPTGFPGGDTRLLQLGHHWWQSDLLLAASQLRAVVRQVCMTWGIQGIEPGKDLRWEPFDTSPLEPVHPPRLCLIPTSITITFDRCIRRLELVIESEDGVQKRAAIKSPTAEIPLTELQHEALDALNGIAMPLLKLAGVLDKDQSYVHKVVITPLALSGRVRQDRKLGGYYRPDAPPKRRCQ